MTTCCSTCKNKSNRFKDLSEAVEETKDSEIIETSSVTIDNDTKDSNAVSELKETFVGFQNTTTVQICTMEYSFCQITDSITALQNSIEAINSRLNKSNHSVDSNSDITTEDKVEDDGIEDPSTPTITYAYVNTQTPNATCASNTTPTGTPTQSMNVSPNPAVHKFGKVVRDDHLEPHRFQTLIKDITLQDDSIHCLRHFYNKLRHAVHTSFKKHVDILPPFGKLALIPNITSLLVPLNVNYPGYTTIRSVYEWFSALISNVLFDTNGMCKDALSHTTRSMDHLPKWILLQNLTNHIGHWNPQIFVPHLRMFNQLTLYLK